MPVNPTLCIRVWAIENDFFGFPKVKWLHLTGENDIPVTIHAKFYQGLTCQKSLKWANFRQRYSKNKRWTFFSGTRCTCRSQAWCSTARLLHGRPRLLLFYLYLFLTIPVRPAISRHGRPHIGAIKWGQADPPGKMDEKLKSENMQKEQLFRCRFVPLLEPNPSDKRSNFILPYKPRPPQCHVTHHVFADVMAARLLSAAAGMWLTLSCCWCCELLRVTSVSQSAQYSYRVCLLISAPPDCAIVSAVILYM